MERRLPRAIGLVTDAAHWWKLAGANPNNGTIP